MKPAANNLKKTRRVIVVSKLTYPLFFLLLFYPLPVLVAATAVEDAFYQGNIEFYPKPVPVISIKRQKAITPNALSMAYREFPGARDGTENKGVRIRITAVELVSESDAEESGLRSIKISSLWKNVHAKQKIDRKSLEKKPDRTMGVGGMFAGRAKGDSNANQQVEKDIAYKIPEWGDHLFLLADGIAYPIDSASAELSHGADPSREFSLSRYGQEEKVQFLFSIPAAVKNMALQFFDNANGHIQLPLAGDIGLAGGSGYPEGLIDQTQAGDLDLGVMSVVSARATPEIRIPDGWKRLTVRLVGKSNSRKGGGANLAQIDAEKYVWLEGDGGFTFNVWSLDRGRKRLHFTPEYFSGESIDFLVPEKLLSYRFAMRHGSQVSILNLTESSPQPPPKPFQTFMDGDVAEWHLYSISRAGNETFVDMGIRGLDIKKGLEIKPYRQIRLNGKNQQLKPDKQRSQALAFGAKDTVVVPPNGLARFVLAFSKTDGLVGLEIQGLRSKGGLTIHAAPAGELSMITMAMPAMETTTSKGKRQKITKVGTQSLDTKKADRSVETEKAVVPKAAKKFTLPDWDMANAIQEEEPGGGIENAVDLGKGLVAGGNVGGKGDRADFYYFDVDGKPQLWAIEVAGSSVAYLAYLDASRKEITRRSSNRKTGEARMVNLLLMPGRHWLKVAGSRKAGDYLVRAIAIGEIQAGNELEPNDDDSRANRVRVGESLSGVLEDGDSDFFRFSLAAREHLRFELETSEKLAGRFSISGPVDTPEQLAKSAGESLSYEDVFPPGDYTIRIRASGTLSSPESYQATIMRKNPFSEAGQKDVSLPVDLDLSEGGEIVAAYLAEAQRISKSVRIKNHGQSPLQLTLETWTSNYNWHARIAEHDVALAPGESRKVPVDILIEPDAVGLEPVVVAVSAHDGQGRRQFRSFEVEADCGAEPVRPERHFPAPAQLLGGLNVAWQGLGAELLLGNSKNHTKRVAKELIDGMTRVHGGLNIPKAQKDARVAFTVKLAGVSPVPVAGAALNPLSGCDSENWVRDFEVALSSDGENYEKVLGESLLRLPREQYFVMNKPVLATHARLRILANHQEKAHRLCLGEWKVIAVPEAKLYPDGLNIASPEIGGHIAWLSFRANDKVVSQLLEGSPRSNTAHMLSDLPNQWVVGFQHDRMARISRLEWEQAKEPPRFSAVPLTKVRLAISKGGAAGPWEPLGEWSINGEDAISSFSMESPTWARFIRFSAEVDKSQNVELPRQIRIFEQETGPDYRSVIGEWGHYSGLGPFEWHESNGSSSIPAAAVDNSSRETAIQVDFEAPYPGTASLGSQSAWYNLVIPPGSNKLEWTLSGDPTLAVRPKLTTHNGEMIPIRSQKLSGETSRYTADVETGKAYYLEVEEPPRSVVFAWDNSGSVAPYSPRIYQAMTSFVEQVQPGREFVNLLPFQDKAPAMLLGQWSDQPLSVLKELNAYPRKDGSSNVELNLKKSVEELEDRDGNRAVIVITDAVSGKKFGNADLWEPLGRVYPRIFTFELHSGRPQSQDKMQDWAGVNSGYYSFFRNQTDLDVGFDRAVCMLRRPAKFELVANARFEKPAGPGAIQVITSWGSADTAIEIILDASGSMYKKLGTITRIALAKSVLKDLMQSSLPQGMPLALRIYGHRKAKACDTNLEIPLQPFKPKDGIRIIEQIDPKDRSKTPLAESLLLVADDLKSASGKRLVILLTDGEESCGGDPEDAIRSLRENGMDIQLNIVGLAIDSVKTGKQFQHWAKIGGGMYFQANDGDDLKSALEKALFPKYQLIDKNGEVVIEGVADGSAVEAPEGSYQLKVLTSPTRNMGEVIITEGKTEKVEVKGFIW